MDCGGQERREQKAAVIPITAAFCFFIVSTVDYITSERKDVVSHECSKSP